MSFQKQRRQHWLNSYKMRQQHDGQLQKRKMVGSQEDRRATRRNRLKVIKGWGMTSAGNISGTYHALTLPQPQTHTCSKSAMAFRSDSLGDSWVKYMEGGAADSWREYRRAVKHWSQWMELNLRQAQITFDMISVSASQLQYWSSYTIHQAGKHHFHFKCRNQYFFHNQFIIWSCHFGQ